MQFTTCILYRHYERGKSCYISKYITLLRGCFYARQQARLIHRNYVRLSVCLSVRPSVCHTSGLVNNGAS